MRFARIAARPSFLLMVNTRMNHQERQEHHKKEREREVAHDKHAQEMTDINVRKGRRFPTHFWWIGLGVVLIFVIVTLWIFFLIPSPRAG
jgi:hypothetical protein